MPLHHFLPATYLGGFSPDEETLPRRDRKLVVGDRKKKRSFVAPASRLAAERNLYSLTKPVNDADFVDRTWTTYEQSLAQAIQNLCSGTVSALEWVRTLVPFVACTLVRGPDFNKRFEDRIPAEVNSRDNTNNARLLELQRLLGPVAAATWNILKVPESGEVIVGDVGFVPAKMWSRIDLGSPFR